MLSPASQVQDIDACFVGSRHRRLLRRL